MYRPKGWTNPFNPAAIKCKDRNNKPISHYDACEYGADAMLEALKKGVVPHEVYADFLRFGLERGLTKLIGKEDEIIYMGQKGTLVFIPDDKE